ncbi:MAG: DMT family transporter [Myxococcota bacterium]
MPERKIGSRPAPGPLWMLGAISAFGVMVLFVKLLREGGMSTAEVMAWRMGPGVPVIALLLARKGRSFRPRRPRMVAARVLFGGTAMATYFWSIQHLSLFTNAALALTQPVFVALLSPRLLGERPGRGVWFSFVLALLGAALVVLHRPNAGIAVGIAMVGAPALVRLGSAVSSALAHMFIRRATHAEAEASEPDAPDTVVLHFMGWVAVVATLIGLANGGFRAPPPGLSVATTAGYIVAMAGAGLAGQLMLSRAYAKGRAPAVALMGYAAVPLSLIFDAFVWSVTVNSMQLFGATVTIGAGLLLLLRGREPDDAT